MRVQVKADTSIPEGYTYIRTDHWTAEEFIENSPKYSRRYFEKYVQEHPKEFYTLDDSLAVAQMTDRINSVTAAGGVRRLGSNNTHFASTKRYEYPEDGRKSY